jgi:hypothetical protein
MTAQVGHVNAGPDAKLADLVVEFDLEAQRRTMKDPAYNFLDHALWL